MAENSYVNNAVRNIEKATLNPDTYLSVQAEGVSNLKKLLKETYDYAKSEESAHKKTKSNNALPELIIANFDLEQIWQQVELQNECLSSSLCLFNVSKYVVGKGKLVFDELHTQENESEVLSDLEVENEEIAEIAENESAESESSSDDGQEMNLSDDDLSLESMDDDAEEKEAESKNKRLPRKSVVDDEFFKLEEMEKFLLSEEKKINNAEPDSGNDSEDDEETDEDFFTKDENDDDNDANNPKYADFFEENGDNQKKRKRNKFLEELGSESEEEGREENVKSTLELREERLKARIDKLEEKALEDKPWQLKGEISAETRPYNSLLEEVVEFDISSRPAPVMTEETTLKLEDIIRQRIKDKTFDSVERKQKPAETPLEYKKKLVLDQEKSKQSLAQIYEQEYLQQKASLDPDRVTDANKAEEKDPELHKEIRKMMHGLLAKLDALSNFHYTPKQAIPELKVVSNLPAINMEEVAPVAASDANLLAPEEVKSKRKGELVGKSERTDTDKKRERRKKKAKQRHHANEKRKVEEKIDKIRPGLGNKYSKEKAKKMLEQVTKHKNVDKMDESFGSKALKSSTAFFTQLQDEVKSQIKGGLKGAKTKSKKQNVDAKKMKL